MRIVDLLSVHLVKIIPLIVFAIGLILYACGSAKDPAPTKEDRAEPGGDMEHFKDISTDRIKRTRKLGKILIYAGVVCIILSDLFT